MSRAAPPPTVCLSTRCPWLEQVLYAFQGNHDGAIPYNGDLIFDAAGNLYGTTSEGGGPGPNCEAFGCGTVFELSPSSGRWTETVLAAFTIEFPEHLPAETRQRESPPTVRFTAAPEGASNSSSRELSYGAK